MKVNTTRSPNHWDLRAEQWDSAYRLLDKKAGYIGLALAESLALKPNTNATVLDVGCGVGFALQCLDRHGYRAVGVDYSKLMLAAAAKRNPKSNLCQTDAHQLPFADNVFNAAILTGVMEFCNDPLQILREISRVVIPGGKVLCEQHRPSQKPSQSKDYNGALASPNAILKTTIASAIASGYFNNEQTRTAPGSGLVWCLTAS